MDFARKQLEKYGWKDGDGLGKSRSGIAKPIKAKLKFDNAGLGHNISNELVNPWWQRVYDSAAKNVNVSRDGEKIKVTTNGDEVEITTKRKRKMKKESKLDNSNYGNFIMRASLTFEGEKSLGSKDDESDDEPVVKKRTSGICDMTDEELFSVCGGRTVHKGARHGLSMSAKLARLEQQELCTVSSEKLIKKKKKKQKRN